MTDTNREVYIENKLEYGKMLLDPKAEDTFKEITKDLALANLTDNELIIKNMAVEIINILVLSPHLFTNSLISFNRDFFATLQLTRSKRALESRLQRSNITENETRLSEYSDKRPLLKA